MALALFAGSAMAEAMNVRPDRTLGPAEKIRVADDVMIYDTIDVATDQQDILWDDVAVFRRMLASHPEVRMLQLNSYGGELTAARDMVDMVKRRGLATRVEGTCDSACVLIYLAGDDRSLAPQSTIGFHRFTWDADSVREFYDENARDYGWDTPFDLAEWLYEDTQAEIFEHLSYLLSRGVDPAFAIQTLHEDSDDMWYPSRAVLIAAGVVTTADTGLPATSRRRSSE